MQSIAQGSRQIHPQRSSKGLEWAYLQQTFGVELVFVHVSKVAVRDIGIPKRGWDERYLRAKAVPLVA